MQFQLDAATERFIRNLPKTETHLHIEGAVPIELLRKVQPELYAANPASWELDFRFDSFASFEKELLTAAGHWYSSPERYGEAARHIFEKLAFQQNVHYVEVSFASGMVDAHGLDATAIARAIRDAAPRGLNVRIFMGIHHDGYHGANKGWIDALLECDALAGLDLHGTESTPLGPWAADLWSRARDAGKATKAHAGEFCGPEFVRRMVDELGVRRIEHGVRSSEDRELMARLAEEDVTLDVCPISNVKLGVVPSWEAHPIGKLLDAGIRCTVSTDDPFSFGNTLMDEYAMLATACGFDLQRLAQVARAGFEVALISEEERAGWLTDFDRIVEESLPRTGTLRKV